MAESKSSGFDLSVVGDEDIDGLTSKIESFYKKDTTQKTQLSYHWERNHMMLDGRQWLVYDGDYENGGMWRSLAVSRANEYIPRPVTNYIFDCYQTLKSYLIKSKPRSVVKPNTPTSKDKSAAKIAELCLEANYERLKEHYNYEYAAATLVTYGTVFKKDYWDTSSASVIKVPRMVQKPNIDPMTGQVTGMEEVQDVDPDSQEPLFDMLPLGDVATQIVEPYKICMDPLANDIHSARWIMEYAIQPLEWIKESYGKELPGFTGRVDEVQEETNLSGSLRRFYQLKNSSGVKNNRASFGTSGTDEGLANSAVVKEYYERPSQLHPKGRMVVVANGVCLYVGDSPYSGPDMGDWHPYSECRWEIVPGRFWGKSPLDNAAEIQKQINSIDSVIVLTRKTMAIPQKLIPVGAGIAHGSWTGRPGQEVFYREAGGAMPQTIPASGVDATVFQERAQRVDDLKNITGAIDILKGDRPPGVNAASALELLYEVGTGKLYPILDRWKAFVESSQKKQLRIISKFYREPRQDYIQMLKSRNSELSEDAISKFIGQDLYDNCNVVVEAGSNIPKLEAAKKARLYEAAQVGALSLDMPANRVEFQHQMGIMGFDNDVGPDIKRAEWENDLLDSIDFSPDNKPVVLDIDQDAIHIEVHSRRMKEPSWMSTSVAVQQAYMQHLMEHEQSAAQKQQAQMMQAAAMGQPLQPEADAAQRSRPIPAGSGPSPDAKKALNKDLNVL